MTEVDKNIFVRQTIQKLPIVLSPHATDTIQNIKLLRREKSVDDGLVMDASRVGNRGKPYVKQRCIHNLTFSQYKLRVSYAQLVQISITFLDTGTPSWPSLLSNRLQGGKVAFFTQTEVSEGCVVCTRCALGSVVGSSFVIVNHSNWGQTIDRVSLVERKLKKEVIMQWRALNNKIYLWGMVVIFGNNGILVLIHIEWSRNPTLS